MNYLKKTYSPYFYKRCLIANIQGKLAEKYLQQARRCKSKNRRENLLRKAFRYHRLADQYWD